LKWFKHDTDCDRSEGLSYLLEEEGFAGYGRWFRLLEIVASKMDKSNKCSIEYPAKKWGILLGLKQKKLKTFLKHCENKLKTKVVCYDNIIRIEIPNLLNKRDEYSQKSGHNQDNVFVRSKIKNKDTDKDIKKTTCPDSLRLSGLLADLILHHTPDHKDLSNGNRERTVKSWAKDIDLMIRLDKRSPENIEHVIIFAQQDSFWFKNILSGSKLRKQFDRLGMNMRQPSRDRNDKHAGIDQWLKETYYDRQ